MGRLHITALRVTDKVYRIVKVRLFTLSTLFMQLAGVECV